MTRRYICVFASLAALCGAAHAVDGAPTDDPVSRTLAEDYSCASTDALPVELMVLRSNKNKYVDQCIRVVGTADGGWLLNSLNDISGKQAGDLAGEQHNFTGMELRSLDGKPFPKEGARIELVGRFRSCEKRNEIFQAAANKKIEEQGGDLRKYPPITLGGACHFMEYVVFSAQWRVLS